LTSGLKVTQRGVEFVHIRHRESTDATATDVGQSGAALCEQGRRTGPGDEDGPSQESSADVSRQVILGTGHHDFDTLEGETGRLDEVRHRARMLYEQ
jgi:hypothetical protein